MCLCSVSEFVFLKPCVKTPNFKNANRTAEAQLASSFFQVLQVTGALPEAAETFEAWQGKFTSFVSEASAEEMSAISCGLNTFLGQMNQFSDTLIVEIGKDLGCQALFERAKQIISDYIPQILDTIKSNMDGQLLESQLFFRNHVGVGQFLPDLASAPNPWFFQCVEFGNGSLASVLKDSVVTMVETLKLQLHGEGLTHDQEAKEKLGKHLAQYHCCLCMDSILGVRPESAVADLRACLDVVQRSIAELMSLKSTEAWLKDAKAWALQNVAGQIFGNITTKLSSKVNDALAAIPDIDSMISTRNSQKIRQIVFQKSTHEMAVGSLEDLQGCVKSLSELPLAIDNLSQSQLAQVQAISVKVDRIRGYAYAVHGLNLVIFRYAGKNRMERSAFLREYLGQDSCYQRLLSVCSCNWQWVRTRGDGFVISFRFRVHV